MADDDALIKRTKELMKTMDPKKAAFTAVRGSASLNEKEVQRIANRVLLKMGQRSGRKAAAKRARGELWWKWGQR